MPGELGQLGSLQTLGLHNNQLSSVPGELGRLGSLQGLSLNNNPLRHIPEEFALLANMLAPANPSGTEVIGLIVDAEQMRCLSDVLEPFAATGTLHVLPSHGDVLSRGVQPARGPSGAVAERLRRRLQEQQARVGGKGEPAQDEAQVI